MLNDHINRFLGVLSYPFVSLEFVNNDLLKNYFEEFEEKNNTKIKYTPTIKDKNEIRDSLVKYIRSKYSIYSYDELYLYLDKLYLYPKYDDQGNFIYCKNSFELIFNHLKALSKSFISQRDGKIIYKYWENEGDKDLLGGFSGVNKIYLFHSLNRLFPLDILSIIFMCQNYKSKYELNEYYGNIQLSDVLLDNVLEQGIAENHLHSGVSTSFLTSWDDLMNPLTPSMVYKYNNINLYNVSNMDKKELTYYIWFAALLRIVILLSLNQINSREEVELDEAKELAFIINAKNGLKEHYNKLCINGDISSYFIDKWNEIIGNAYSKEYNECDIVYDITCTNKNICTSSENIFLFEVISYLMEQDGKCCNDRNLISTLFINYLRIKNYFYSLTVQQKTTHGLDYFQIQYYGNNSNINSIANSLDTNKTQNKWERAIREQLQNGNLKKLELRASIYDNESSFKKNIFNFLKAYRNILRQSYCDCELIDGKQVFKPVKPFPKIGLVFHLLKSEQDYFPEKCINMSDSDSDYLQYGTLYKDYEKKINILKNLREGLQYNNQLEEIFLDKYLVGLDVASLENTVPTWVFAPIYEKARDSKIERLRHIDRPDDKFQSLGFTFHAGEDFRHLLSGIRRIYEVVKYLKFHAGDRIGHGIALGISPETWHRQNPTIIIPRIEALENYLWAYSLFSEKCSDSILVNLAYLEKRIYELSKEIYGTTSGLTTNILVDAYIQLFKDNIFEAWSDLCCKECGKSSDYKSGLPDLCNFYREKSDENRTDYVQNFTWDVNKILTARQCKKFIYKMNEPIHYCVTSQDIEIVKETQKLVKEYISQQGIVIEINPSSNIAISDIDTLSQNQIYDINTYSYNFDNIIACINSDDPSVFNTNVSNELAYIYFTMLEKGISRETTLQWIDKLRRNGMHASFIRRKDSDEEILKELDVLIDSI